MRVVDTVHITIENFNNRKSRTFLTVLGVGVGIGAVLFLVSLGYGLQQILLQRITTAESFLTLDIASTETKIISLNFETLQKVERLPNVERVSPQALVKSQVSSSGLTSETDLNLVDAHFLRLSGITPQFGRSFGAEDRQKLVVNSRIAELFNSAPSDFMGKMLTFQVFAPKISEIGASEIEIVTIGKEFEVVGVIDDTDPSSQVYADFRDFEELGIKDYQFAKVKVGKDADLEIVREQLINMGFLVSAISDIVDQANRIFRVIQVVLGIFGVIAVVVAAISLVNTMTISLLERTQDIGIMRAIGGSRTDIRNLFLIESTIIGFSGGIFGIVMGYVVAFIFNAGIRLLARALGGQPVDLFYTPYWFLLFIVIFSTSVGLISGVFPARRASRLKTLDALRYK